MGGIGGTTGQILSFFQSFAEAVVAAGATILNDFLNALAGTAAHDRVIEEFSTQNTYFYTDDAYIDALHNPDKIVLNSLIRGTSFTDEVIDFYKKAYSSHDFHLEKALAIVAGTDSVHGNSTYAPLSPTTVCNYINLAANNHKVIPSVSLRINNKNLYAGTVSSQQSSNGNGFPWHSVLGSNDSYNTSSSTIPLVLLDSTTFPKVQAATKDYLKYLGAPAPENLLDDLPYGAHSNIIDSAFINFRVKWVSGLSSTSGNRISNKYLYLLAQSIWNIFPPVPRTLTYTTDTAGNQVVTMFTYAVHGDGHNYSMGLSHVIRTAYTNQNTNPHAKYQYDKDLTCSDGYYYYDADKTLPTGDHSAKVISDVSTYLANSGTTEVQANWLEIEQKDQVVVNGVNSIFVDEIDLTGSGITLTAFSHVAPAVQTHRIWTQAAVNANYAWAIHEGGVGARLVYDTTWYSGLHNNYHAYVAFAPAYDVYIDAADQVLRVGNLYIKKSTTEIMIATVPSSVYANASITYGRSNATSVIYYKVFNISAIERITDYSNDSANNEFRYISHKLDASNACVSAPILLGVLNQLDPLEQHKLLIASANLSMHLAHYERIEKTWEQKARVATLETIRIAAIIFAIYSLGTSGSLVILAENIIVAYATSLAVNVVIEQILVPIITSNFGEDEALILLAAAAVAIAYYSSESGTAGLNQFSNQATLFTASIDIMNQMYSLAVVEPGLLAMQKEQEEWTTTDNELTEKEETYKEDYEAIFGTEDSPSYLLNLQIRAALNPMPASAYVSYHDDILERQFDCFDYDKYNELNVS
tara:strand:+ start:1619 stop:4051 length:2433 start_codon:yes stop_codon:yes gene_type:complete